MSVKIYAHRGASLAYPENTLDAFSEAIRLGADGIELDVQRTLDGHLVVIHDEELSRLAGSPGLVKDLTLSELRSFNVAHHAGKEAIVPTLSDVFDLCRENELEINIELKNSVFVLPELEREVVDLVNAYGFQSRVIYSSFNHLSIKQLVELGHGENCGLLFSEWLYQPWDYARQIGASALHPSYNVLQCPDLIATCHKQQIVVRTWTVDRQDHIDLVLAVRPDVLMTNDPALALARRALLEDGR